MTVKHILITMFVPLSFGAFYIWLATHPAPPPTPEEQAAYRQQEAAYRQQEANRAQQQAERAARFATLCKQQQMCKRYKDAVKNCAPAANFDACMKILMPEEDIVSQMSCLSDGSVRQPSADMPSTFVCLLNGYP
jgi:hypothetical protein